MFKKITVFACTLVCFISFSQEQVSTFSVDLKKNDGVYQIVDNKTKETTLFFIGENELKLIRMDSKMQFMDSLSIKRPDTKIYKQIIGDNGNAEHPTLYFSSSRKEKITAQSYNFLDKKSTSQFYDLKFKNEIFLKAYSKNNKLYLLSVPEDSNILKLHLFDETGKMTEKAIDLSSISFQLSDFTTATFYDVLNEGFLAFDPAFTLQDVNQNDFNSLVQAGKKRKCYFRENQFIITIDTNVDNTQIITIDLNNFTANEKYIEKPLFENTPNEKLNSNSYLIDNLIYQIKCTNSILKICIKDFNNNLVNEYSVYGDNPIPFKNTSLYKLTGDDTEIKTVNKTSDFIRKTYNNYCGLSCSDYKGNIFVTIGGVGNIQQGSGAVTAGMFGALGSILYSVLTYSNVESLNPYSNRLGVYTNCIFDKSGKPVSGTPILAIDKLRTFASQSSKNKSQTIFKIDTNYFLGYYDLKSKSYLINKFQE